MFLLLPVHTKDGKKTSRLALHTSGFEYFLPLIFVCLYLDLGAVVVASFFHRPPLSAFFVLAFHSLLLLLFIPSDFDCTKKARRES